MSSFYHILVILFYDEWLTIPGNTSPAFYFSPAFWNLQPNEKWFGLITEKPSSAKQRWDQKEPTWPPFPFMAVDLIRPLCNSGLGKLSLLLLLGKVLPSSSPGFPSGGGEGNGFLLSEAELWAFELFFWWESFDNLPRSQSHCASVTRDAGSWAPFLSTFWEIWHPWKAWNSGSNPCKIKK